VVGGGGVSAEVSDGCVEVAIGVKVGEREGVVFKEGGVRRKNGSLLFDFQQHFSLVVWLFLLNAMLPFYFMIALLCLFSTLEF